MFARTGGEREIKRFWIPESWITPLVDTMKDRVIWDIKIQTIILVMRPNGKQGEVQTPDVKKTTLQKSKKLTSN